MKLSAQSLDVHVHGTDVSEKSWPQADSVVVLWTGQCSCGQSRCAGVQIPGKSDPQSDVHGGLTGVQIDKSIVNPNGFFFFLKAAQHHLNPGGQLFHGEGFDDVVLSSPIQSPDPSLISSRAVT